MIEPLTVNIDSTLPIHFAKHHLERGCEELGPERTVLTHIPLDWYAKWIRKWGYFNRIVGNLVRSVWNFLVQSKNMIHGTLISLESSLLLRLLFIKNHASNL